MSETIWGTFSPAVQCIVCGEINLLSSDNENEYYDHCGCKITPELIAEYEENAKLHLVDAGHLMGTHLYTPTDKNRKIWADRKAEKEKNE